MSTDAATAMNAAGIGSTATAMSSVVGFAYPSGCFPTLGQS
jgi:hypothetical protein